MQEARVTEWLKSIEGVATALSLTGAAVGAIFVAIEGKLVPTAKLLGLGEGAADVAARGGALLLLLPFLWFVVRSYRRFARASRIEQPDRFTLSANTPDSLIGRSEDLAMLQETIAKNRVVMLDGESGCGKSALVSAGLVPRLVAGPSLLPILIRDWGDDWVRGPLASALGALYDVLTPEQRGKLGWTRSPDLAAEASVLAAELDQRYRDVVAQLTRRSLLITDQFDDYQARYRERFVDSNGNWLKPDELAAVNSFWALTRAQLQSGALHLLAVTRADTASGLSCVRFLDATMTADRHLPRVDLEYLRPLLERIAPADASPVVVSQPDQGWHELRDRLETDLRLQGAVLMQQVRTVLLGVRQFPMLNLAAYRRAGELRGTESLVIARAIQRAGDAVGGGEARQTLARRVLGALVLPGGANQPPKAKHESFDALTELVGDDATAKAILRTLQSEDLVRPAEGLGGSTTWQLDHDYLAHAVLAEARQADRWGIVLREGQERFRLAGDAWRRRWTALLPSGVQARLAWEWFRGRLRYGEAAGYARLSLMKPTVAALLLGTASAAGYFWNEDRLLTLEAIRIYEGFGSPNETAAVLDVWRAPRAVRSRLYRLVQEDESRLQRAIRSAWPIAHGGMETWSVLQSGQLLRSRLARETNPDIASKLAEAYSKVTDKLADQFAIQQEAAALRVRLERETDPFIASNLAQAYATVAAKLADPSAIRQEAAALRERLARETNSYIASKLAQAYATVAAKLADPSAIQQGAAALHERLARETDRQFASHLAQAYATVAAKLADPSAIQQEVTALRERLASETDFDIALKLAEAYSAVAAKLADPTAIQQEAAALRERLARETDPYFAPSLAQAYATVASKLADPSAIQQATAALRERLARETNSYIASTLAEAYATVAVKLADPSAFQREAAALRERLARETDPNIRLNLAHAYATVAAKLTDPSAIQHEAAALRERLARETDRGIALTLAQAYATVAVKLTDPSAIQQATAALREQVAREIHPYPALKLTEAYATVAAKLTDPSGIQPTSAALRERLERETDTFIASKLAQAYATVAATLADPSAIQQTTAALRELLARETKSGIASTLSEAYATVAVKLADSSTIQQEAAALRELLARETNPYIAPSLAQAYATVAAKLADPSAIQQAAAALRELLARETNLANVSALAQAYATVAVKLADSSTIQQEAGALRELLARETNPYIAPSLAQAYATVAAKLTDPSGIQHVAAALREWLARETDLANVSALAQAYATVMKQVVAGSAHRADRSATEAQARQILVMAGHPFLTNAKSLLAALDPAAGHGFGSDTGAAVAWWRKEFKGDPATLRPPPAGPP